MKSRGWFGVWAVVAVCLLPLGLGSACSAENVTKAPASSDDASAGDDVGGDGATNDGDASDASDGDGGDAGDDADANPCDAGQTFCGGKCIDVSQDDANCGACGTTCTGAQHCGAGKCIDSPIQHVVLIVQENHTFDSYFGLYCTAAAYSNPACTSGPTCCEAAPSTDPSGAKPYALDDDTNNSASNFATDRNHDQACELQQINAGKMDQFVSGGDAGAACNGNACATNLNWVLADGSSATSTVAFYWTLAGANALADRYFQPIAGGTASNNMYLAAARFRFTDNGAIPTFEAGEHTSLLGNQELCTDQYDPKNCLKAPQALYSDPDIASLILNAGKTFAVYADGYANAAAAVPSCPSRSSVTECPYNDCTSHPVACNGCIFDPGDIPFTFFSNFNASGSTYFSTIKDYGDLQQDLAANQLPSFAYVKARLFRNEHPNMSMISYDAPSYPVSSGVSFVKQTIDLIQQSAAGNSTLILLTWDEGGGFFDHVAPPTEWSTSVDQDSNGAKVPYGTRVPMLAIGPFAATGKVSHVPMEHSSVVRFLEWNFLGNAKLGTLGARDSVVNNIGSMLDPNTTVVRVPEKN